MKTVLCSFCLKSGILCQKCSSRVESGDISQFDLKIARLLLSLEEKFPSLQNVNFHKAVEAGKALAVVVGQGDVPKLLGYGGKIVRAMEDEVGKRIRVLESGVDERKFLEDLFAPLSIVAINKIWLPDGSTETRAILRRRGRRSPPFDVKSLKEIASKVRKMTLRVEYTN